MSEINTELSNPHIPISALPFTLINRFIYDCVLNYFLNYLIKKRSCLVNTHKFNFINESK